jgi:hypothetical protein
MKTLLYKCKLYDLNLGLIADCYMLFLVHSLVMRLQYGAEFNKVLRINEYCKVISSNAAVYGDL